MYENPEVPESSSAAHAPPPAAPPGATVPCASPAADPGPGDYRTAGVFLLIGGVTTALASAIPVLLLVWFCVGACWLPMLAVSIWTIATAIQVLQGVRVRNVRLVNALALVAALLCCDVVGVVLNVFALVWLSKEDVARWIERPA